MNAELPKHESHEDRSEKSELLSALDALIVLGKLSESTSSAEKSVIHKDAKMRVLAAMEMYETGMVKKIIFSGGKTSGEDQPSEAALMYEYLLKKYPDFPPSDVILEEKSINTQENAQEVGPLLKKYGLGKAAVLTSGYHAERAQEVFEKEGLEVSGESAEGWLRKKMSVAGTPSQHYAKFIDGYERSSHLLFEKTREMILKNLLIVDPHGKIPQAVTHVTRGGGVK